ncbi:MAG: phosphatidate cytidylyltransferase [Gammaproteobacteria bacterium]|nr:phosphatidate cytidylyltransferase [Gammaproteobacteria bacterium]
MLKQRIITGIVLAIVVIGTILKLDTNWVIALFAGILFVATWELLKLTIKPPTLVAVIASGLFVVIFWWSLALVNPLLIYWQSLAGLVLWVLITFALIAYRHNGNLPLLARILLLGLGLDLLWICVHGLIYLYGMYGGEILLYLLSLVWVADIGAYFSGRRFGKRKLAPAISPGKTWEGFCGGLVANLLWIIGIYFFSTGWGFGFLQFVLIGVATSLISVVGDLFESILKREAGVKDSGKLLPGHGGVLDRIDSLIAASPVFVAGTFLAGSL